MPSGAYVCSGSMKHVMEPTLVKDAVAGRLPVRKDTACIVSDNFGMPAFCRCSSRRATPTRSRLAGVNKKARA